MENFIIKLKVCDLKIENFKKDKIYNTAIDKTKATTPPNLLGIDRKMAYANRKYHSGWIWIGVTRGLAEIKFSGSPNTQGWTVHR